jgi:hypothetical protein
VSRRLRGTAARAAAAGLLALALGAQPALATRTITTGFLDQAEFASTNAAVRATWLTNAAGVGAHIARIDVTWSQIAPARPSAAFVPSNPASPGYNWTSIDAAVRDVAAHGLSPMLTVYGAPTWAEGPGRAAGAPRGTWEPDPQQLASFATAIAQRYSGAFPDPLTPGAVLPAVHYWQAWNEPNLATYLTPQWATVGGQLVPVSATNYRALLNAFYAAVKAQSAANVVASAGLAPYGDYQAGGQRIPPVRFERALLCLQLTSLRTESCPDPVHLDALAQTIYPIGGPSKHALQRDDVALPDIGRLKAPLNAALHHGRLLPATRKPIWVTEFSWDSNPPDPQGVPVQTQAQYLDQALNLFWRQGVAVAIWLNVRDQPPVPSYGASYQSGVYFIDGTAKPSATAYAFPFAPRRISRSTIEAWGLAKVAGGAPVAIQRRVHGRWHTLRTVRAPSNRVFDVRIRLRGAAVLRAQQSGASSLLYAVGR